MTIADDFKAINRRMRELRGEKVSIDEPFEGVFSCDTCLGIGWIEQDPAGQLRPPYFEECPDCHNPEGLPLP